MLEFAFCGPFNENIKNRFQERLILGFIIVVIVFQKICDNVVMMRLFHIGYLVSLVGVFCLDLGCLVTKQSSVI